MVLIVGLSFFYDTFHQISDYEVLTAAHCTESGRAKFVRLGEHNTSDTKHLMVKCKAGASPCNFQMINCKYSCFD